MHLSILVDLMMFRVAKLIELDFPIVPTSSVTRSSQKLGTSENGVNMLKRGVMLM